MTQWSNYAEGQIIGHVLRNSAWTQPSGIYCSLHTGDPGETGANELAGGGYTRKQVDAFDTAASRATANTNAVTFAPITAAVGTISYAALWDAQTNGNLICYSTVMSSTVATAVGIVPVIAAGGIDVSFSGEISTYLANALLDHIFGNTAYTTPGTSLYVSLHTGDPGLTGANEVSGNGYARVQEDTWDSPTDGATSNTDSLNFGTPTPSDWGTITYKGVWDASTSGNFLISNNLDSYYVTSTSGSVTMSAGDFDVVVA